MTHREVRTTVQFKFEWDDREVRRKLEKLPSEITWEYIEEEIRKMRMRGVTLDSILYGPDVPRPTKSVIGGVPVRLSFEVPRDKIVITERC